jgi:hypothetical protein
MKSALASADEKQKKTQQEADDLSAKLAAGEKEMDRPQRSLQNEVHKSLEFENVLHARDFYMMFLI